MKARRGKHEAGAAPGVRLAASEAKGLLPVQRQQRLIAKPDDGNRRYDLLALAEARLGDLLS